MSTILQFFFQRICKYVGVYIHHIHENIVMPRLFYGDMRQHETAYKHQRADEATNDLIMGAKLSAYTGFEDAKTKAIDEIATNYGNFLKALKTKEIPLANANPVVAKKDGTNTKEALCALSTTGQTQSQSDSDRNSLFTELNPNETPQMKAVLEAYNVAINGHNVAKTLKNMRTELDPAGLNENLTDILHMMGYRASTGKQSNAKTQTYNPLTITALQEGVKALWNGIITPPQ